ncbi:MAG: DUF2520 domain-containing protein [Chlorobi bacterium]|nr:DUF2520 domain-containing protein [Chlorobiota bacterium]
MNDLYKKENYKIAIIGAGIVAPSLAGALVDAKFNLGTFIHLNKNRPFKVFETLRIKNISSELKDLPDDCNLIFLAVLDDEIKPLAENIKNSGVSLSGKYFVHLSGAKEAAELEALTPEGKIGSMNIVQNMMPDEIIDFKNSFASIETEDEDVAQLLVSLANELELKPFRIGAKEKILYNLMGVFTANYMVSNIYNAEKMHGKSTHNTPEIIDLLTPLIQGTLNNIKTKGIASALSGPIERGEVQTVKEHIEALKEGKLLCLNYITSSLSLLEAAKEAGKLGDDSYQALYNFLHAELREFSE